jgi:hypothetical protein
LAESPTLRLRFGERSRERAVSQFDLVRVAARIASLYRELLRAKRAN